MFLSEPDLVADLIFHYVTADIVKLLDLSALRCESPVDVDKNLVERIVDFHFSTTFIGSQVPSDVLILFEHQSTQDRLIPFRLMESILRNWRHYLGSEAYTGLFPCPFCIVLHHGKKSWREIPAMGDLIHSVPGVDKNIFNFPVYL
ncbi:Rpn family recombination-promoting nuclease/putative transposase, partial [Desulfosarcina sp. OttesenSCG-928-B08]|nr:Rpn family recombination-promoting nuclease/putative transposase [Desulfosarcina sp. OttesenSCG-928-B08]